MRLQRKNTRIIYLLFVGIAAAVISLGSLINFHQYKIWGKPLIHEFIGYKRDNYKSFKIVKENKTFSGGNVLSNYQVFIPTNTWNNNFSLWVCKSVILSCESRLFTPVMFLSPQGLRAPPVA